jgi:hypothetical protein
MAYVIFRKFDDGALLPIEAFDDLTQAQRIAELLCEYWPGDYSLMPIDASDGNAEGVSEACPPMTAPEAFRRWLN